MGCFSRRGVLSHATLRAIRRGMTNLRPTRSAVIEMVRDVTGVLVYPAWRDVTDVARECGARKACNTASRALTEECMLSVC